MTVLRAITDLVSAVIWPLAVVVVLVVYRRQIPKLASVIVSRVSGVTLPGLSLAFAVASEPSPQVWSALRPFADPLAPESVPDSGNALFVLINGGERVDSVRFDLRTGRSWLTSRLYIFAVLLPKVLGVRCLVFTETRDGVARRFVGLGEPDAVAAALARRCNWFRFAWARASINMSYIDDSGVKELRALAQDNNTPDWQLGPRLMEVASQAITSHDLHQPGMAENIARGYLTDRQIRRERPKGSPIETGWVQLRETDDSKVREEHAQWIVSGADLDDLLGDALTRPRVIDTPGTSARQLIRHAVLTSGQFVAVVDGEGRFQRLLHREAIVEQLANEAAERETDSL